MWQRIQTVWLLLVGIIMIAFSMQDIAVFTLPEGHACVLDNWRIYSAVDHSALHSTWAIGVLSLLTGCSSLGLIFLFKRRLLQMRLTILTLLVIVGELCYIAWASYQFTSSYGATFAIRFPLALPIICLPLLYLASRRMIYDETLVRASQRLR